jgi:hypothetical protein
MPKLQYLASPCPVKDVGAEELGGDNAFGRLLRRLWFLFRKLRLFEVCETGIITWNRSLSWWT